MKKWIKILVYVTFLIYSFVILHIVLLSRAHMLHLEIWREIWVNRRLQYGVNLIPFKTICGYIGNILHGSIVTIALRNLLGNLFMFLPLGIYLPVMNRKCRTFAKTLLVSLAILVGIELVQFITLLGSLDIDDLILNLSGVMMGYALWKCLKPVRYFNL